MAKDFTKENPKPVQTFWWLQGNGSILSNLKSKLSQQHYIIVLVKVLRTSIKGAPNRAGDLVNYQKGNDTVDHWVVLNGFSSPWRAPDDSSANWVRVNNPFSNQPEYYSWKTFHESMNITGLGSGSGNPVIEVWTR